MTWEVHWTDALVVEWIRPPTYFLSMRWTTCSLKSKRFLGKLTATLGKVVAWENSRHLATLPLVSPPNDVWETRAEIPHWWRVITQIWVVLLIGRAAWEIWFNQSDAVWNFCPRFSLRTDVIWRETSGSVAECRLFSEASKVPKVMISRVKIHLPFALLVLCNWLGKHERKYYALSFSFYLGARTAQGK